MKPSALYRIASGLLVLFAIGHALGFHQSDPAWGVEAVLASMQSSQFTFQGFTRTYWDFFVGAGFAVGVLYIFAAVLAWQLGSLPRESLALLRATLWGFACCFAVVTVLGVRYLFWIPIIMSALITVFLSGAAWCAGTVPVQKDASPRVAA